MGGESPTAKNDVAQIDPLPDPIASGNLVFLVSCKIPTADVRDGLRNAQVAVKTGIEDRLETFGLIGKEKRDGENRPPRK